MSVILETDTFMVQAHQQPHHSRENGGHIVIAPKQQFAHRYEMPLDLAASLMHLTMIVGEAATIALRSRGLDVVRINYQDNGNWAYKVPVTKPKLHVHLYIRTSHEVHPAQDPRFQPFPDALVFPDRATGYYDSFLALNEADCNAIRAEYVMLAASPKYRELAF